ncbi:RNA polymerase sigma factor RpoD [subsurface metagenome]|jgi:RNA polymerase primary sigma factor
MEYSQQLTNNEQQSDSYKIDSIPHITAVEERALWRKYIKLRHIRGILTSEGVLDDIREASPIVISRLIDNMPEASPAAISRIIDNMPEASSTVISQIIKEISSSHDLIVLLRRHAGLDKLGDTIIEDDAENKINIMIELYRLIQYSKKKRDEKIEQNNSETCCLEDLFGFIFGETLNNIAFGKGNPALVGRIAKAINREPTYIKDKLFELAVNRELLPKSVINLFNPKTPLSKLPNLIKSIPLDSSSEFVLNDYQPFIMSIKAEAEKAFNRIIESHIWLVLDIVNKHFNKDVGLPRDDLVQEGNLGLIEAAERFQPTLSVRFMQYAHWWIFQKIQRVIANQARTIRVPVHMLENINQLLKTSVQLSQEYGRGPTYTEISEQMGISSDKVKEIVKVARLPVSLESSIGQEEGIYLSDLIEDQGVLSPFDVVSKQLLKEQIDEVLSTLTPREQRVLTLRFGLEDDRNRTLEEVGREFNLTRERIRQIEEKALRRLRHPSRSRKLKGYLE